MPIGPIVQSQLWDLAQSGQPIDASALSTAIQREAGSGLADLDFRTRLLVRDAAAALRDFWNPARFDQWLTASPASSILKQIDQLALGEIGFPSLHKRIMDTTKPQTVLQFLRELGIQCHEPLRLEIGGAIAAILAGMIDRHTEIIDVVDEIPLVLRQKHQALDALAGRYGLDLTHFQSHYLPSGWRNRLVSLDRFGELDVWLVDAADIFLSKLFSARAKDRDDLRAMATRLDKPSLLERQRTDGQALLGEPRLAKNAADNWYVVFGETLLP
jgi:hypothetical protein